MRSSTVKVHMKTHDRNVTEVKLIQKQPEQKIEIKTEIAEERIAQIAPQPVKQKVI
jgi:hypothetical protein